MTGVVSANPIPLNIAQANNYISTAATSRGLDPGAVRSVEAQEGGSGRVGDAGTSFGPFQLHEGGALPNSIPLGSAQSWAWSQPGINYALDGMSRVGAAGLKGNSAISTIVSKFERPANPQAETANAERVYTTISGNPLGAGTLTASSPTVGQAGKVGYAPTPQKPVQATSISGGANSNAIVAWALNNSKNLLDGKAGSSISGLTQAIAKDSTNALLAAHQDAQPINQLKPTKSLPHGPVYTTPTGGVTPLDQKAIALTKEYLGTPYKWAGDQPGGFDCSGLLQYVWGKQGVTIPRTTYQQYQSGSPVSKANLRPGDAVFFKGSDPEGNLPGHVGMYIGGGKFIDAPYTGQSVRIDNLSTRTDYVGARRYA